MSKIRVCFLGTPEFAVTCLKRIVSDAHYEVVGVVTQPDRPAGRKMALTPSPVKVFANSQGLPVLSPDSINKAPILDEVQKWGAEVAIVVAFGQIVSQKFLDLFPFGAVNVHGSLLPKWRGAAPIQRSIEAGDSETGVALQKMVKELDAGDVLGLRRVTLDQEINAQQLYEQLAELGADLLRVELMDFIRGNLVPVPQDPALVTHAKKIEKAEAQIAWTDSAKKIHNKVRAFAMGPGTWATFAGKKLKVHKTKIESQSTSSKPPGTIVELRLGSFLVATGSGVLEVLEVQPESRNRQPAAEFIKGHSIKIGDILC